MKLDIKNVPKYLSPFTNQLSKAFINSQIIDF